MLSNAEQQPIASFIYRLSRSPVITGAEVAIVLPVTFRSVGRGDLILTASLTENPVKRKKRSCNRRELP